MTSNVYYDPDHFGLTPVAEAELSGGYEFDTVMVWRKEDGSLVWAKDSGCSCPIPFESHNLSTLRPVTSWEEIDREVRAEWSYKFEGWDDEEAEWSSDYTPMVWVDFQAKVVGALRGVSA